MLSWMPLTATSVMFRNVLVAQAFGYPLDQRLERSPVLAHHVDELGRVDHLVEPELVPDGDRLVAQQFDPRVLGVKAAWRGLQLLSTDLEPGLLQLGEDPLELLAGRLDVDRRADPGQVGAAGVVEASAGAYAARRDLDVEPAGRPCRDEGSLVGLV